MRCQESSKYGDGTSLVLPQAPTNFKICLKGHSLCEALPDAPRALHPQFFSLLKCKTTAGYLALALPPHVWVPGMVSRWSLCRQHMAKCKAMGNHHHIAFLITHSDVSGNLVLNSIANEIIWSCYGFYLQILVSRESQKVPSIFWALTVNTSETEKYLSQSLCIYW